MANVGVNVPVPEVIGYMGSLYAENIVLAEWMLDPDKVGVALSRTWMYQEMAFGPLDREAMGVLFERLRGLGRLGRLLGIIWGFWRSKVGPNAMAKANHNCDLLLGWLP